MRFWLLDLAEECAAAIQFPETSPFLALDRLWITSAGHAVLLDFQAPGVNSAASTTPLAGVESMQQFLSEVARVALEGINKISPVAEPIHALVPLHARSFLTSLARRSFEEARVVVGNLQSLIAKPAEVTRARRAASLAFVPGIAFALAALIVMTVMFERVRWNRSWAAFYPGDPSAIRVAAEIYSEEAKDAKTSGNNEELKKIGAYIATHFGTAITNQSQWASQPKVIMESDAISNLREAQERYSSPDAKTLAEAEREMPKRIAKRERNERSVPIWIGLGTVIVFIALASLVDLIGTLVFRVFPVLRVFGFSVANRAGASASRGRLLARWALVWGPGIAATFSIAACVMIFTSAERIISAGLGVIFLAVLFALVDAVMIYAVLRPNASLADHLAGTRLVPL